MTSRLPCRTPGCSGTILPDTAERTDRLCMPCVHRARREQWERHVAEHRVEVDRFAGVTDVVELIRLSHEKPRAHPLVADKAAPATLDSLYRRLTQDGADRLVDLARGSSEDMLVDVAGHLACFSLVDLHTVQQALLDVGLARPSYAFCDAKPDVVQRLLGGLADDAPIAWEHGLAALAWTRSAEGMAAFDRWQRRPPPWASQMYVAADAFTRDAGYALRDGSPRSIVLPACAAITEASEQPVSDSALVLFAPVADPDAPPCPSCHTPPVAVLTIVEDRLPAALRGHLPARVIACMQCASRDAASFTRGTDGGTWTWVATGPADPRPWPTLELSPVACSLTPRSTREAVDWLVTKAASQLGGLPAWVGDWGYEPCPLCDEWMTVIAQVDEFGLGGMMVYVSWCRACDVGRVSMQCS